MSEDSDLKLTTLPLASYQTESNDSNETAIQPESGELSCSTSEREHLHRLAFPILTIDNRDIVWFDIDNTLYSASTRIADAMGQRIHGTYATLAVCACYDQSLKFNEKITSFHSACPKRKLPVFATNTTGNMVLRYEGWFGTTTLVRVLLQRFLKLVWLTAWRRT